MALPQPPWVITDTTPDTPPTGPGGPGVPSTVTVPGDITQVVESEGGLQGPPGPASDKTFFYTWNVAATSVSIQHNLGKRPSVTVVDSAGTLILVAVAYDSVDPLNKLTLTMTAPFSGSASLN